MLSRYAYYALRLRLILQRPYNRRHLDGLGSSAKNNQAFPFTHKLGPSSVRGAFLQRHTGEITRRRLRRGLFRISAIHFMPSDFKELAKHSSAVTIGPDLRSFGVVDVLHRHFPHRKAEFLREK